MKEPLIEGISMTDKARIAVMVSGTGTNLQALIDAQKSGLIEKLGSEKIKGISHITGGGFYENIPRSIPGGLSARISRKAIRVLPIFDLIAKVGVISDHDMFNTFNMGVGMTVIVSREDAPAALNVLRENGEDAYVIGVIARGSEKITIE